MEGKMNESLVPVPTSQYRQPLTQPQPSSHYDITCKEPKVVTVYQFGPIALGFDFREEIVTRVFGNSRNSWQGFMGRGKVAKRTTRTFYEPPQDPLSSLDALSDLDVEEKAEALLEKKTRRGIIKLLDSQGRSLDSIVTPPERKILLTDSDDRYLIGLLNNKYKQ